MAAMVDHRTGEQKIWTTVVGVVLLVGGVVLGAVVYGNVPLTVVAGVIAVIGLGLLRYALLRRLRARRA
jgi:MFS superfamily sulfate permease-like transporter